MILVSRMAGRDEKHMYPYTLSLVIPAAFDDYRCFTHQLLRAIAKSYVLPDEVILVISGVPRGYADDVESVYRRTLPDEVQITFVRETPLHNQAINKNTGASIASGDLVLFFDMDDVLHPWGIYAAKQAYQYRAHLSTGTTSAIMFSHHHYSDRKLARLSESGSIPHCTAASRKGCLRMAWAIKRSRGFFFTGTLSKDALFHPFCTSTVSPCQFNSHYRSTKLYLGCFAKHVATSGHSPANWCCLTADRPNFAAGWLLVNRDIFLGVRFKETLDVAEDGELIGRLLGTGVSVKYVDVPIGFYNQEHLNPRCSSDQESGFKERNWLLAAEHSN